MEPFFKPCTTTFIQRKIYMPISRNLLHLSRIKYKVVGHADRGRPYSVISDSEYDDIAYLSVRMKETTEGGKVCERCICTVM